MSIGVSAISDQPLGAQAPATTTTTTTSGGVPKKRRITAKADVIAQPEPR